MPAWTIHIALAHKLKPNNNDFLLGNILPDILDGYLITPSHITSKDTSHFRKNKKISPELFIQKNEDKLNNPIVLGYLTHLLTDNFYNEYTAKKHFIKKNDKTLVILNNQKLTPKTPNTLKMKQQEFTNYGKKLASQKLLGNPITINNKTIDYLKDLPFNYSKEDIDKTINTINNLISNSSPDHTSYQLFTEKELDNLYNNCYKYLKEYLNSLH